MLTDRDAPILLTGVTEELVESAEAAARDEEVCERLEVSAVLATLLLLAV